MTAAYLPAPFVHHPTCPDPQPMAACRCGENAYCRSCTYGRGSVPCSCRREQPLTLGRLAEHKRAVNGPSTPGGQS